MELFNYYCSCDRTKTARNHIALIETPKRIAQWAEPPEAYMANLARIFISYQANVEDYRDDYQGDLVY